MNAPTAVLITSKSLDDYPVFKSCFAEKNITLNVCRSTSYNEQIPVLVETDFVFFAPDIKNIEIIDIIGFFESHSIKAFTTICFEGDINTVDFIEYASLVNHFIPDIHNDKVIKKKLSNLASIQKLRNEKTRLKELEKTLEEESSKLVEINVNNVKLIAEINEKTKLIDIARKDIQNLLDNLTQGFFTINQSGIIQNGFSRAVEYLFELSPLGRTFAQLLRLENKQEKELVDWLELLFNEIIPYKDLIDLAPKEFSLNKKFISLDYQPIRSDTGKIEKLIIIATDRTREKEFETEAKRKENFIGMILSIVKDRGAYRDFCDEAHEILDQLNNALYKTESDSFEIATVFRLVHTLKGNAASFHFAEVKEIAHVFENKLSRIRESTIAISDCMNELRNDYELLKAAFLQTKSGIITALGDFSEESNRQILVKTSDLQLFRDYLEKSTSEDPDIVHSYIDLFIHGTLDTLLVRYESTIKDIASRMGKQIKYHLEAVPVKLHLEPYKALVQSLIHMFRNALDHGIETPEERIALGKEPFGTLSVSINPENENKTINLVIKDDGRGIDVQNVKKSAIKKGLYNEKEMELFTKEQLYNILFMSGFSTKSDVTEWSGRGVGLDAVAKEIEHLNGKISISSEPGCGTSISIQVPVYKLY